MKVRPLMEYMYCPFCSGEFTPVECEDGSPALAHTIPYCPEFEAMDPAVYLRVVRERKGKFIPAKNN